MKSIKTIIAFAVLTAATPAHAFEPTYAGQGHYKVYVPFQTDTMIAEQVAAFCRSKGKNDFLIGFEGEFGEQDFMCIGEGEEVVQTNPTPVTPVFIPFVLF